MDTSSEIPHLYYRKFQLAPGLEKFVKYAWIMKSFEAQSKPDLLIPDGYPEIIFVQKGGYRKEFIASGKGEIIIKRSCVIGMQTQSVLASRIDECGLLGLKLQPMGAYLLFGTKLKEILNENRNLQSFGVEYLKELDLKLQNCEEEEQIRDVLSHSLLQQTEQLKDRPKDDLPASVLSTILRLNGKISIQLLAAEHGLGVRHFQRKFKDYFGISPKKFLNIIRFKHLYKASILKEKKAIDFLDYGYYDQMHFIKDFRKHLGITPSKRIELNFLQMNQMAKINS
ncbi:MAG: helix-turn-helix domain-containing protein [Bacteroidota bacterium]